MSNTQGFMADSAALFGACHDTLEYRKLQHERIDRREPIQIGATLLLLMGIVYSTVTQDVLAYLTHSKDSIPWQDSGDAL